MTDMANKCSAPLGHLIDNRWYADGSKTFVSCDPVYGEMLWEGPQATQGEIDRAMQAAGKAFEAWSVESFEGRKEVLSRFIKSIDDQQDGWVECIAMETGKPIWEAQTEVLSALRQLSMAQEAYDQRSSSKMLSGARCQWIFRHRPQGVVVIWTEALMPALGALEYMLPALLAGNAVVFKPSEYAAMAGQWLLERWVEAGLPGGVLNMVQGGDDVGYDLINHQLTAAIWCCGSHDRANKIHRSLAGRYHTQFTFQGPGDNALIVQEVSSIESAVYQTLQSSYRSAGQFHVGARHLILPKGGWYDRFLKALIEGVEGMRVAAYDAQPEPFMGSMISYEAAQQVIEDQKSLVAEGARPLVKLKPLQKGTGLLMPGLLDVTAAGLNYYAFNRPGPLLKVHRVAHFEQAIERANQGLHHLACGLVSENRVHFDTLLRLTKASRIFWNRPMAPCVAQVKSAAYVNPGIGAYGLADRAVCSQMATYAPDLDMVQSMLPGLEVKLPS